MLHCERADIYGDSQAVAGIRFFHRRNLFEFSNGIRREDMRTV
jgi:hypothetical protein